MRTDGVLRNVVVSGEWSQWCPWPIFRKIEQAACRPESTFSGLKTVAVMLAMVIRHLEAAFV